MKIKQHIPFIACLRCGHTWVPRQQDVRICPHCKTASWDKPKKEGGHFKLVKKYSCNGVDKYGVILFDADQLDVVDKYNWYIFQASNTLYASGNLKTVDTIDGVEKIQMHRLVMGNPKGLVIHHINHNGLDNRKSNLEALTNSDHLRKRRNIK